MNNKKLLIYFLIGIIILGVIFRGLYLPKEISAEESDFINPALAIKDTGHPVAYNSELYPKMYFLLHPPMYIFLLAFIFKFGFSEVIARSVNVIFSLLTAFLIYLFCREIIRKEKGKIIGLISSAFFMINYYVFSSSVLIDIDILSMFFTLSFVYSILKFYQTKEKRYFYFSIIFLLFSICNRYPVAFLVYVGIGIYYLFDKKFKSEFKNYLNIGVYSFIVFLILWGIYSLIIEPGNFFSFLSHNFKLGGEQLSNPYVYFASLILNIAQFTRLFTFPAVLLMIMSLVYFYKTKSHLIRILLIYTLGTLIFFLVIPRPAFGYPRYFASIFPGIFILLGIFLYLNLKNIQLDRKTIFLISAGFIISLLLLILLSPQPTIYNSKGLIKATNLPDFIKNLFASIPLLFIFHFKKGQRKKLFILMLIALSLSYSIYFTVSTINYEPHIKEISNYIIENTNKDDLIIAPKAIGYYTQLRYHLNDNNKPELDFSVNHLLEYIKKSYENPEMDDEFFWPKGLYSGLYSELYNPAPSEEELKKAKYVVKYYKIEGIEPEKKIGEFYLYNPSQLSI